MNIKVPNESSNLIRKLFIRKKRYHFHVGIWSLFLGLLFNLFPQISNAQVNVPYWKESFSTAASGGTCNLTTINPTSIIPTPTTDVTYYFNGNGSGVWWGKNIYNTTGTGCPSGNEHVRFRNMGSGGTFDSGELVTPVVNFGIQEFHFYRARASRNYRIFITNDTGAQTTNWTLVANLPAWPNPTCADTAIIINSATAKRLKIQALPGFDYDIDSIWLTNYSPQVSPLVPGNLIVQKVGTGNTPLSNQSAPFKLIQIGTTGTVIDSIQIPFTGPDKLVCQGSSTSDGQLTLSADRSKLVITGYVADTGIASISGVASTRRSIKTIDIDKNIIEIANGVLTGNARCAASNGTNAYLVGSSIGVMGGLGLNGNGLRDTISKTSTNNRSVQIHKNQLYFSTASSLGGSFGIYKVGTGTPNTPLVTSTVFLPVPNNISINQFAFNNDTNICYAADDNSGGGIKKFTRTGSTWSLVDSFEIVGTTARNVIVDWTSSNPIIYAIFGGNQLIKVTDIGSNLASRTHQVLYITSPNTAIRGLSFSPGTQFIASTPTAITNNTISGDQNYCSLSQRDSIIGSTPTNGTGTYTYFWQVSSTSATSGFGSFSNNTGKNFMPISSLGNTWYRRIVTSGTFKDTSAVTKININRVLNDSIYGPNEVCQGTTSLALRTKITSSLGVTSYSWLRSTTDSITGFAAAPGTNNLVSYSPGIVNQTSWYKVVASSGTCLDTTKTFALRPSTSPNSIIPGFSGPSGPQGGPIVGSAYQRGLTIYPASEVQDILSNGDSISKVGWVVQSVGGTAFSQGVSGQLKVYLVNTNDADMQRANSSSTWSGILSSPSAMSLCYDSSFTLPTTAGAYFVRLQNKFAYTGQGIYVAIEWVPSTTISGSSLNYALNLNISNGTFNGTSNSALPNTLNGTILRPRIVLGTNCITAPPPASLATVSTRKAISISSSSAILGGDISSDGGASVTERGIVYSTNANPTISTGTKVTIGAGIGGFFQNITSLTASTTYYVRAYAINSVGTSYGGDSTFTTAAVPPSFAPTVSTSMPTLIGMTNATLGGNVSDSGTATVTERGVVYATTANPTTANNKVIIGSGTGNFSQNITGLTASTTYHVRAYAINSIGTSYGGDSTFTTAAVPPSFAPTVSTSMPTFIGVTNATLGGNVSDSGTATVTERGVVYATSANPTTANNKVISGSGIGSFSQNITGLTASTTYYVRAYAINSVGTSYGGDSTFTTAAVPPSFAPTVSTSMPTLIGSTNATLGGNVSDSGTATVTERGVVYATSANPTTANNKVIIGSGLGSFSQNITGLTNSTTYHVRAYAINSVGTSYGSDSTFTTAAVSVPTISLGGMFDPFTTCQGTASGAQQFTVGGTNLSGDIMVSAPSGFELSLTLGGAYSSSLNLTPTSGVVSVTTLYIRISSAATGTPSGNITATATGASTQILAVNGILNTVPPKPIISTLPETPICAGSNYINFGASIAPPTGLIYKWSTSSNATLYAQGSTKQYALVSFPNVGNAKVILTSTLGSCSASTEIDINVKGDTSHEASVRYFNNNFVCQANLVSLYQWGYDDVPTLKGNAINGEINQNYFNPTPDLTNKAYWVISTKGNCYQKSYYNVPSGNTTHAKESNPIKVYPNPFSAHITISSDKGLKGATLFLIDIHGKEIANYTATMDDFKIDLSDISSGIYFLSVGDKNGIQSISKIIKY